MPVRPIPLHSTTYTARAIQSLTSVENTRFVRMQYRPNVSKKHKTRAQKHMRLNGMEWCGLRPINDTSRRKRAHSRNGAIETPFISNTHTRAATLRFSIQEVCNYHYSARCTCAMNDLWLKCAVKRYVAMQPTTQHTNTARTCASLSRCRGRRCRHRT